MTDPYTLLGDQLSGAAGRREARRSQTGRARTWLSRRLNAAALAVALMLTGGAIAAATTGILDGSPVRPEAPLTANAGNGVPAAGGSHLLALRAADPEGGLPWGMRVVRTTRGLLCLQIGRVRDGQLGELGVDGAFGDDGRFHALSPEVLPGYGASAASATCVGTGQTVSGHEPGLDRSAAFLTHERLESGTAARKLRSVSYGLLGPHALSITYRTAAGVVTSHLDGAVGAYLIVAPADRRIREGVSDTYVGGDGFRPLPIGAVSAITYRFGRMVCTDGTAGPVSAHCPTPHRRPRESWFNPTRSLHEPLHATLKPERHAGCDRAFLVYPCYLVELEFSAPFAVSSAGTEYDVMTSSSCEHARLSGWSMDRNVARGETARTLSTSLFVPCRSPQRLEVRYLYEQGPSKHSPHESVIVGAVEVDPPR